MSHFVRYSKQSSLCTFQRLRNSRGTESCTAIWYPCWNMRMYMCPYDICGKICVLICIFYVLLLRFILLTGPCLVFYPVPVLLWCPTFAGFAGRPGSLKIFDFPFLAIFASQLSILFTWSLHGPDSDPSYVILNLADVVDVFVANSIRNIANDAS